MTISDCISYLQNAFAEEEMKTHTDTICYRVENDLKTAGFPAHEEVVHDKIIVSKSYRCFRVV